MNLTKKGKEAIRGTIKSLEKQQTRDLLQIITDLITQMNSSTAKIKRAANEAKEVITERIEVLKIEAEKRFGGLRKDVEELGEKSLVKNGVYQAI